MKPAQEFRDQLFLAAGAPPSRLMEFSCGHVVPADNLLPVVITAGPTGRILDMTHAARQHPETVGGCSVTFNRRCPAHDTSSDGTIENIPFAKFSFIILIYVHI